MSIQEQILEVLKQQLLPEIAEIKAEQQEARNREIKLSARLDIIDGRLDQIDKRLDQMDKRLDQMDKRLDQMDKRLDQMDKRFDQMDERFDRSDRSIRELHEDLREVRSYVFVSKVGLPSRAYQVKEDSQSG